MAGSVPYVFAPCEVKTIDDVRERTEPHTQIDTLRVFREALEAAPQQHKELAHAAGYQPDYWSRVLAGERGVTLDKPGLLPRDAQIQIVTRWAGELGLRIERRNTQANREALAAAIRAAHLLLESGL